MASIEALAAAERIAAIEDRDYAGYVGDVAKIIEEEFYPGIAAIEEIKKRLTKIEDEYQHAIEGDGA